VPKIIYLLIFSSFLDIWENVEWPRFFGPPCRLKANTTLRVLAAVGSKTHAANVW